MSISNEGVEDALARVTRERDGALIFLMIERERVRRLRLALARAGIDPGP